MSTLPVILALLFNGAFGSTTPEPDPAAVKAHMKLHAWLDANRPGWDTARDEAGTRTDCYGEWRTR